MRWRVMLTKNINVEEGLVNGSMAWFTLFNEKEKGDVTTNIVLFPHRQE